MSDGGALDYSSSELDDEPKIVIYIETLTGTAFEMMVHATDTVLSIKKKIQFDEGISTSQQHLLYGDRELKDTDTLHHAHIANGATLKLVLGMRGGPISTRRVTSRGGKFRVWKDFKEFVTASRHSTKSAQGAKVTLLVIRDGDVIKILNVLENDDASKTQSASSLKVPASARQKSKALVSTVSSSRHQSERRYSRNKSRNADVKSSKPLPSTSSDASQTWRASKKLSDEQHLTENTNMARKLNSLRMKMLDRQLRRGRMASRNLFNDVDERVDEYDADDLEDSATDNDDVKILATYTSPEFKDFLAGNYCPVCFGYECFCYTMLDELTPQPSSSSRKDKKKYTSVASSSRLSRGGGGDGDDFGNNVRYDKRAQTVRDEMLSETDLKYFARQRSYSSSSYDSDGTFDDCLTSVDFTFCNEIMQTNNASCDSNARAVSNTSDLTNLNNWDPLESSDFTKLKQKWHPLVAPKYSHVDDDASKTTTETDTRDEFYKFDYNVERRNERKATKGEKKSSRMDRVDRIERIERLDASKDDCRKKITRVKNAPMLFHYPDMAAGTSSSFSRREFSLFNDTRKEKAVYRANKSMVNAAYASLAGDDVKKPDATFSSAIASNDVDDVKFPNVDKFDTYALDGLKPYNMFADTATSLVDLLSIKVNCSDAKGVDHQKILDNFYDEVQQLEADKPDNLQLIDGDLTDMSRLSDLAPATNATILNDADSERISIALDDDDDDDEAIETVDDAVGNLDKSVAPVGVLCPDDNLLAISKVHERLPSTASTGTVCRLARYILNNQRNLDATDVRIPAVRGSSSKTTPPKASLERLCDAFMYLSTRADASPMSTAASFSKLKRIDVESSQSKCATIRSDETRSMRNALSWPRVSRSKIDAKQSIAKQSTAAIDWNGGGIRNYGFLDGDGTRKADVKVDEAVAAKKPRCLKCRKKLNITTIHHCRCGRVFCSQHRYSEVHGCEYDYKTEGRKAIERENPMVLAEKLPKI